MERYTQDPDEVLDWVFSWSDELNENESIVDHSATAEGAGLTVDSSNVVDDGKSVVVWVSGGNARENGRVNCHIATDQSREYDRSFVLRVRER